MAKDLNFIMLREIAQNRTVNSNAYRPFVDPLNQMFSEFGMTSDLARVHFLAQAAHETAGFKYLAEVGSADYLKRYEMSKVLGNTQPGDGVKYKGRGLFQITGRFNYSRVSNHFKTDFLSHPELLETIPWACRSAGWFWTSIKLQMLADENDFLGITYRINGGFNGLVDRYQKLIRGFERFEFTPDYIESYKKNLRGEIIGIIEGASTRLSEKLKKALPDSKTVYKFIL